MVLHGSRTAMLEGIRNRTKIELFTLLVIFHPAISMEAANRAEVEGILINSELR